MEVVLRVGWCLVDWVCSAFLGTQRIEICHHQIFIGTYTQLEIHNSVIYIRNVWSWFWPTLTFL